MVGCGGQVQPTTTSIVVPTQINTPIPSATPNPLSTYTPSPPLPATLTSPLPRGAFEPFRDSIFEPTRFESAYNEIIKTSFGVITSGFIAEEKISVDSTMSYTTFSLFWEEGDLDLTLIQPDGKEIIPTTPKYHVFFLEVVPQSGTWTMRISGKSTPVTGSKYMIQVTSMVATSFSKHFDKDEYVSGDIIKLFASIEDSTSGSLLAPPAYIHGVSMKVMVEDPAKKQYSFELYDDGHHGDGKSDDGIYTNTFSNTLLIGKYNFYLQISGNNNRDKQPFTREYFFSTVVK